jgi:hypothetical protein
MPIIGAARLGQWKPLAALLRSDEQISYEVRLVLADILDGKLTRPNNQPPKYLVDKLEPAVRVIRKQRDPAWRKQEAAIDAVAKEMPCSVRSVKESLKQYRELEGLINRMQLEAAQLPHEKRLHIEYWAGVYKRFLAGITR